MTNYRIAFIILIILASGGEDPILKKATSNDVARLAGVSQTAVSLILNGSEKISFSEDTKEYMINEAKKQLDID